MFRLYNSLTKQKESFTPINPSQVGFYTCGFTVYDHTHIGSVKKYVGDDLLRRTLEYLGYPVKHVQNVTDVGHLESDADEGEDKLEKGALKHGLSVLEVARKFEDEFYQAMKAVNVKMPHVIERAASDEAIKYQLELIEKLIDNGYAYIEEFAIYFDVSKLPDYNPFSNQLLEHKLTAAREDVEIDPAKRNPSDFVLWMFKKGRYQNHAMYWDSPWGEGFPGWHIECSAISIKNLGTHFDIHTGGIDHIAIHHPNEIAQNYGVTGDRVVSFWVHHEFLKVNNEKMSKSKENYYTLEDLTDRGFEPLDLRYFILGTHYRKQINFTWEALESAKNARRRLYQKVTELGQYHDDDSFSTKGHAYVDGFAHALEDDVNIPQALAITWDLLKDTEIDNQEKIHMVATFDEVFGLDILVHSRLLEKEQSTLADIPREVRELAQKRSQLRREKKFTEADLVRDQILEKGYEVLDKANNAFSISPMGS